MTDLHPLLTAHANKVKKCQIIDPAIVTGSDNSCSKKSMLPLAFLFNRNLQCQIRGSKQSREVIAYPKTQNVFPRVQTYGHIHGHDLLADTFVSRLGERCLCRLYL